MDLPLPLKQLWGLLHDTMAARNCSEDGEQDLSTNDSSVMGTSYVY